ncbi:hypothetical protein ACIO6T_43590 [Streptomyces sp. NPDC087532]|uniref:hypothetical protein n=1 Tax=Streptomyces sp. NPDC087532 TaxID=3365795 RepID=UPI00382ADC3B
MPLVVGLLEQRELGARRRVDGLREDADRIQAELAVAEPEWEWLTARSRVGEVLAPAGETGQDHARADLTATAAEEQPGKTAQAPEAAKVNGYHGASVNARCPPTSASNSPARSQRRLASVARPGGDRAVLRCSPQWQEVTEPQTLPWVRSHVSARSIWPDRGARGWT